ncbi:MAG: leucine-rich repeat domain-containing protein [Clostridia bacterium]|nr:leucine-rich repeat domain-containing protein [Clostridia bacterium]
MEDHNAGVIGGNLFYECKNLNNLVLHINLRFIGVNTFVGCTSLTDVYYEGTKAQWKDPNVINIIDTNAYTLIIHCSDRDITWSGE